MIRVVIPDDQQMVRSGLRALLSQEPDIEVVGEAADGSVHVSSILSKLGLTDRVHAVIWAYQYGIVQPGAQPYQS